MISIILITQLLIGTPLSVATTDDALATLANPAGLGTSRNLNFYYLYNFGTPDMRSDFWHSQTFAFQAGNLGISYIDFTDFRLGIGSKVSNGVMFGSTYRRVHGRNFLDAGLLLRPHQYLSIGAVAQSIGYSIKNQYIFGIGLRPLTNRVTLTCDVTSDKWTKPSIGFEADPFDGVEVKAKINPDGVYSVQLGININNLGLGSMLNSSTTSNSAKRWAGYLRLSSEKRRSLVKPSRRFLEMTLSGTVADVKTGFSLMGSSVNHTTYQILKTIKKATDDNSIKGMVLKLENPSMGFAIAQEIKAALNEFKKQHKQLIVYAANMDNIDYFIASSADQIISYPMGETHIPGISSRSMYLKGILDKLGLEYDFERIGKHKNAPEPLIQDTMSAETREVINSILDDLFTHITTTIAEERNWTVEQTQAKIDQGFYLARQAKEANLIDDICYGDELDSILKIKYQDYSKIDDTKYNREKNFTYHWQELPVIAIIYANGQIMQGESHSDLLSGENTCGAATLVKAISQVRNDKNVKAIVLRIDSPGGDGFASDLIFRELLLAKRQKPVIVSMGPVAASGGYYIAMLADKIFVSPSTITGSIGAFIPKLVTRGMYEKVGANIETIKRGERADAFSGDRKFNDDERQMLQDILKDFYAQFISQVAQYRNLTVEYVDSVGQGRVWTGNQAQDNKLVDSIGGLLNAIDYAKEKAQVKEVKLEFGPASRRSLFNITMSLINTLKAFVK